MFLKFSSTFLAFPCPTTKEQLNTNSPTPKNHSDTTNMYVIYFLYLQQGRETIACIYLFLSHLKTH